MVTSRDIAAQCRQCNNSAHCCCRKAMAECAAQVGMEGEEGSTKNPARVDAVWQLTECVDSKLWGSTIGGCPKLQENWEIQYVRRRGSGHTDTWMQVACGERGLADLAPPCLHVLEWLLPTWSGSGWAPRFATFADLGGALPRAPTCRRSTCKRAS